MWENFSSMIPRTIVVPLAQTKWYLITTIDDHSRRILHGELWDKETSWTHIVAQKAVLSSSAVR